MPCSCARASPSGGSSPSAPAAAGGASGARSVPAAASSAAEPGAVVDVFQKGYTVNGRLARAARVVVAKAPEPSAEGTATGDGGTPPDAA